MDSALHHEIKEKIYDFIKSHKKRISNFDSLKRIALTEMSKESWQEWEDYICRISDGELEAMRSYIKSCHEKERNYLTMTEIGEIIREHDEIMSIGALKKIIREIYPEEKSKEYIKTLNSWYSKSKWARRIIKNNFESNKQKYEEWDAEAWHELGIPTDEDGDPIGI